MDEQQKSNEAINIHLCIKCIARRQWNQKFTLGDLLVLKISLPLRGNRKFVHLISFVDVCTHMSVCVRVCISLSYRFYR